MPMLRRIRGLLGLAVTFGVMWVPLGLTTFAIEDVLRGRTIFWNRMPALTPRLAMVGAFTGVVIGIALLIVERRRTFANLTMRRMVGWGALGGLTVPLTFFATGLAHPGVMTLILGCAVYGALGAVAAAGVLAVARRAPALPLRSAHP